MPLTAYAVRIQAQHPLRGIQRGIAAGQGKGARRKAGMVSQKPAHGFFVFFGREGAGAVHQPSAGAQHRGCAGKDAPLALGTACGRGGGPLGAGFGMTAEHALSAAGSIHQHGVERTGPACGQCLRLGAHHQRVGHAHALNVAAKNFRTGGHRLVAHQQPLARQRGGDLRALAAGRGAQVQHAFAGLGHKCAHRSHGAGFLQVIRPRLMQRIGPSGAVPVQIAPQRGIPWHGALHAAHGLKRRIGDGLFRIEAQTTQIRHLQRGKVGLRLFAQLRAHAVCKGGRQFKAHRRPPAIPAS